MPSWSSSASRSAFEDSEIPSTATIEAMPIATPSADSAARRRRVRRPSDAGARAASRGGHAARHSRRAARRCRGNAPRSSWSWVIMTIVVPSACSSRSSSTMSAPDATVEVAGRLVGEHDRRPPDQRPGDRHPLTLAAGQLGRQCSSRCASPTRSSACAPAPRRSRRAHPRRAARRRRCPARSSRRAGRTAGTRTRCARAQRGHLRSPSAAMSSPSTCTVPALGRSSVPIMCNNVDLPDPDGPTIATAARPRDLQRHAVQRATPPGYSLPTPRAGSTLMRGHHRGPRAALALDLDEAVGVQPRLHRDRAARSVELDGVPAALAREQRRHRYREHVLAALDREADVDRRLVERCRRAPRELDRHLDVDARRPPWSATLPTSLDPAVTTSRRQLDCDACRLGRAVLRRASSATVPRCSVEEISPTSGRAWPVADVRLRLADAVGAGPEQDLAAARRAVLVEPVGLLEAPDRRGGRCPVELVVSPVAGVYPSARSPRSSGRTSSASFDATARSRATPAPRPSSSNSPGSSSSGESVRRRVMMASSAGSQVTVRGSPGHRGGGGVPEPPSIRCGR